jgi:hypothetical protein
MHRLITKASYCVAALILALGFVVPTLAQDVRWEVGGGPLVSNETLLGGASAGVTYRWTNGLFAGLRYRMGFQSPVQFVAVDNQTENQYKTDGTANLLLMQGVLGWSWEVGPLSLEAGAAIGGSNVAHQRMLAKVWCIGCEDEQTWYTYGETYTSPSLAAGLFGTIRLRAVGNVDVILTGGYDWMKTSSLIAANSVYNPDVRVDFASPGPWITLGIGQTLGSPLPDTVRGDYRLYLNAMVASLHPFTWMTYNQFNPGLGLQLRFPLSTLSVFAEGGAYQYSLGDLAAYAGGGLLVPLWLDWLKGGVFGGLLITNSVGGLRWFHALSPRITIDTKWASFTSLLIPAGEETAIGFMVALPIH